MAEQTKKFAKTPLGGPQIQSNIYTVSTIYAVLSHEFLPRRSLQSNLINRTYIYTQYLYYVNLRSSETCSHIQCALCYGMSQELQSKG